MNSKIGKIIGGILGISAFVSVWIALSSSGILRDAPKSPNPATGHTIEMSVRGVGTVYVNQTEWDSIAPYWNTFYVLMGLFLAYFFCGVIYEGYKGFMRGWRSDEDKS